MATDQVAARYAQALFESAKAQHILEQTAEQLALIGETIRREAGLRQLLWNPDVDPEDKVGVLDRILQRSWSELVRAFVRMVVSMGRAERLPKIMDAFGELVDEDQGRLRVTVRSVRAVPEALLQRLRAAIERRERKHVEIAAEIVPELLGGMQVSLGHRVIDGSVQRQLGELRRRLLSVRLT